jgi:hypothetical protein
MTPDRTLFNGLEQESGESTDFWDNLWIIPLSNQNHILFDEDSANCLSLGQGNLFVIKGFYPICISNSLPA